MATRLEAVSIEALLAEIQRRFDTVEKVKSLLSGGTEFTGEKPRTKQPGRRTKRRRGGTSAYARQISKLVQTIRHARNRKEDVSKLEKKLSRLRSSHKG